jgi:hypothetical protein
MDSDYSHHRFHEPAERPVCSGCGPPPQAAELTVGDTLQSLVPARDLAASGRYRGTADVAGVVCRDEDAARPTPNIVTVRSSDCAPSARRITADPKLNSSPQDCSPETRLSCSYARPQFELLGAFKVMGQTTPDDEREPFAIALRCWRPAA